MIPIPPILVRWAALAGLGAALYGYGLINGIHKAELEAEKFQDATRAIGQAAHARKARVERTQTTINKDTDDAHAYGLGLLRTARRLREPGAGPGSRTLPAVPPPAHVAGPAAADPVPAPSGTPERQPDTAPDPADIEFDCAETTLMYLDLLNAWHRQTDAGQEDAP
ncbi:hypothetical protein [Immundisolibacter sp.]|uniref:hypothetical protein n=1 Tax=Immundisolibacter sp. TaxID=1934948 RepID=UPI002639A9DA|nr:hypothetical protein [Immundisolibacter sp.]MDD3652321.1 hypothetical protein [Immundisolibacter sp.]